MSSLDSRKWTTDFATLTSASGCVRPSVGPLPASIAGLLVSASEPMLPPPQSVTQISALICAAKIAVFTTEHATDLHVLRARYDSDHSRAHDVECESAARVVAPLQVTTMLRLGAKWLRLKRALQ